MQKKKNPIVNDAMPCDPRAEAGVIGSMLIDPDAYWKVSEILLSEKPFLSGKNRMIYAAISALAERDIQVDSVTLADELRRRGQLEEAGGLLYMSQIVNATPSSLHAVEYAEIVARLYKLRQLIQAAQKVMIQVSEWQEADADQLVAECERIILEATDDSASKDGVELVEQLTSYYEALEERRKNPGQLTGISTGLKDLDVALCGLNDGDFIVVAGRPSMGKSGLFVRLAASAASAGHRVLFFSAEMTTHQLLTRFAGMQSGIDMTQIRDGRLTDDEMAKIGQALEGMSEYDVTVYNGMDIGMIRSTCRREQRKAGSQRVLVLVDHLGKVTTSQDYGNMRTLEVSFVSMQLKAMAMELNVPVVAASQLNRKCESRNDKRPMLSDLRDSGSIEQDADVVAFLYRDKYYNPETAEPNVLEMNVAKQRNGLVCVLRVWYRTSTNVFADLELKKIEDLGF